MSPTQPYQSRLFQTVRSQFRRIKDSAQLRWRQLKVATTWGAQVALYPFYTLFQAARWGGQALKQATASGTQALLSFAHGEAPAPTDRPIQNVLDAIEFLELPMADKAFSKALGLSIRPIAKPKSILAVWRKKLSTLWQPWRKVQPPTTISDLSISASVSLQSAGQSSEQRNIVSQSIAIRGIASLLVHQRLVLVTSDNQILDVLTSDRQRQLHQRIIWEIAQFQYVRRQLGRVRAIPAWKTWQALPIKVRPQWSFPVRATYHLMAWVQHQPLTRAALMLPPPESRPVLVPQPVLASLREWWAILLPSSQPSPSSSPLGKGGLRGVVQGITHFTQTLMLRQNLGSQNTSLALPSQKPVPILSVIGQKFRSYRTVLVAVAGAIALLPFTFAMPEPAKAAMVPSLPAPLPSPLMVEPFIDPARSRRRWQVDAKLSEQSGRLSQGQVRIAPQKAASGLSATSFEGAIADWAHRFSKTTKAEDPSTIEVDAVFMGYDHHPLEVLLLWLDRAIAWIEGQLTKIGGWLFPKIQSWMGQYWHRP
jgi:hypothetical protein